MNCKYIKAVFLSLVMAVSSVMVSANGVLGKEFTVAFPTNYRGSGVPSLYMAAYNDSVVTVSVPSLSLEDTISLVAGEVTTYELPQAVSLLGQAEVKDLGVFIESTEDITVYGMSVYQYTTDGFTALPNEALGTEYYVLSYYPLARNNWALDSELAVVATEDDTTVYIVPSVTINSSFPANELRQIVLNKGQTFQLGTSEEGQDISGTYIRSNKPIGVYGAHECADLPSRETRIGWCDYLVESMIPTENWGSHYDIVPLATRLAGDVFRVIASKDDTVVVVNNLIVATLNAGGVYEGTVTGPMSVASSKPIYVAQYAMGQGSDGVSSDPFMMSIVPFQQFLNEYLFATPANGFQNNYVNVVIEPNTTLFLDGSLVDTTNFSAIPGSDYIGGQVSIESGQHVIVAGSPFGAYVYGFNSYESYGYPAGLAFGELVPSSDAYSPNIGAALHVGHEMFAYAGDSEDINANGVLDDGEDINSNGIIDARSEDVNLNGQLDAGEDTNSDSLLSSDIGYLTLRLADGSDNVELIVRSSTVSRFPLVGFSLKTIDFSLPGSGTVIAEDLNGNQTSSFIEVPAVSALIDVQLTSYVAGDRLVVDQASFSRAPESVVATADGVEVTWKFDKILSTDLDTLTYEIALLDAVADEQRLVTRSLSLSYVNTPNGERKERILGPQTVAVSSSAFNLNLTANTSSVGPQSSLMLSADITNSSKQPYSTYLQFEIINPVGDTIASTDISVSELAGGDMVTQDWVWDSGSLYTGSYLATAKLLQDGNVTNETQYQFQIVRGADVVDVIELDTAIGSDAGNGIILEQQEFNSSDIVPVAITIQNNTANEIFNGGKSVTQLLDSNSVLIESKESELNSLPPGTSTLIKESFTFSDLLPGEYTVWIYLYDDSEDLISVTSYTITIVDNTNAYIDGVVDALYDELLRGDLQQCLISISNSSSRSQTDIPVTATIVNVSNQLESDSAVQVLSLSPSSEEAFTFEGETGSGVTAGDYACVISTESNSVLSTLDVNVFNVYNLIANPGLEQVLEVGDTLNLDATGSREADGLSLDYQWTLVTKPNNSEIVVADETLPLQSFVIDQQGEYVFELIVFNGAEASLPKQVFITVTNRLPIVKAGPDQLISVQQTAYLNGFDSTDLDNDFLEYSWVLTTQPVNSVAQLVDANTGTPSVTIDEDGVFVVELTVTDDAGGSAADEVILSSGNLAPVADAINYVTGRVGDQVTLDGTASYDVNGDALTYDWVMVSRPVSSSAILINGRTPRPYFDIDVIGSYTFELVVSDGALLSDVELITVNVGNAKPIANAGPDGSFVPGSYIYLDGTQSSDEDGDSLGYSWTITSTPYSWYRPSLVDGLSATPSFYARYAGDYVIQLRVYDGTTLSDFDTVRYTLGNVAPTARAYLEVDRNSGIFYTGDEAYLSSYTYDANSDPLTLEWELTYKPEGSNAYIVDPQSDSTSFTIDEPGDYVAQLTVSDGALTTIDTVYVQGAQACVEALDIRPKDGKIQLTWEHDEATTLVDIYRSNELDGNFEWVADTTNTYSVFIDEQVENGTQYYYRFEREVQTIEYCAWGGEGGCYNYDPREDEDGDYYDEDYGDIWDLYYSYESCESQIISSIPDRRVRYNLVPDLRDLTTEAAEAIILANGFTLGDVELVRTNATQAGLVVQQDAPRNSRLPSNSEINLYVASW